MALPRPFAVVTAVLFTTIALASCGGESPSPSANVTAAGVTGPSEVAAEPVNHAGDNPFTPSVGKDEKGVKPPAKAVGSGGPVSYRGNLPGLYGGTSNHATCDAEQLVTFLERTPDKAAAWAHTLEISTSEIRMFVSALTPVILRTDTRVTNHGFVDGRANPIQSVLQAGTAVFVNTYGRPVVKCYCGNPLTAPLTYTQPRYTGPIWTGFAPSHITIINQSTTVINVFKLYDPRTDTIFARPAGSTGDSDRPYHGPGGTPPPPEPPSAPAPPAESPPPPAAAPPAVEPPTAPPAVETTTAPPPQSESPSASFSPNPGRVRDTFVLSVDGFQAGSTLAVELTRPDGAVEHYTIDVNGDGTGSYTFRNTSDALIGTYTATIANPATGASASASVLVQP